MVNKGAFPAADHLIGSNPALERYKEILGQQGYQELLSTLEKPLPGAIRINTLKVDPHRSIEKWQKLYNWDIKCVPYYEHGWQVRDPEVSISRTIEHSMGEYYVQDAASMLPVSLFDKSNFKHRLILDMAASPGGKTTHISDITRDGSLIIANDGSASRIQALKVVLQNWGSINFAITNYPGEQIGNWYPDTFDAILLDAPCSMENLRHGIHQETRQTTTTERLRLSQRQFSLLESAFKALKSGGQLVYATCSLAPEEDEMVLDALLKKYPREARIVDIPRSIIDAPGLTRFGDQELEPSLRNALRLWPHIADTSGFFCAKIDKLGPVSNSEQQIPSRDFAKTGLRALQANEVSQITGAISDDFGFDIQEAMDTLDVDLFSRNNAIFLVPRRFHSEFNSWPFHSLGMQIGKLIGLTFQPTHEFLSRFGYHFTKGIVCLPDEQVGMWMAGLDLRSDLPQAPADGRTSLVMDNHGRILGGGKVQANRLRNLLPSHCLLPGISSKNRR